MMFVLSFLNAAIIGYCAMTEMNQLYTALFSTAGFILMRLAFGCGQAMAIMKVYTVDSDGKLKEKK